jgi:hypothetical protein
LFAFRKAPTAAMAPAWAGVALFYTSVWLFARERT